MDERCELITATEVSTGSVHEAHRMGSLLDGHARTTGTAAEVCVADSKYGTIENYPVATIAVSKVILLLWSRRNGAAGVRPGSCPETLLAMSRAPTRSCARPAND